MIRIDQLVQNHAAFIAMLLIAMCLKLTGCRATAAPDAGFLEQPQLMHEGVNRLPFNAVWFKPGINYSSYKKVYVAPVDTTHLLKQDWWDDSNFAPGDQASQAQDLGEYFRQEVGARFTAESPERFKLVEVPDSETLIIELAIVEVVPTKVWLNTIGYIAIGALSQGTTAIEGRFKDGASKEVIAEFKDREYGQIDIVSINDLTWFKHSKHTIRIWADDIEEICTSQPEQAIKPMSSFTLKVW